ncbi:MAG: hypothetical protein M3092_06255 [Actinomycetia bacterium]|nr:hypothetical protein [Actinomycetes bacterium]
MRNVRISNRILNATMSDELLDAAIRIADRLCSEAIWSGDQATWLGDCRENVTGEWEVVHRSLHGDVYGGTAGIAVFLSRLWNVVGDDRLERAARGALAYAVEWCRLTRPTASLYSGSAGVACALAEAGSTFGDTKLADVARDVAQAAIERLPSANDLISGRAGAITALLYLGQSLDLPEAREAAREMGDGLSAAAQRTSEEGISWASENSSSEPALCGFAHGASGMSYAFNMLASQTGDATYRDLAADAAIYERSWYQRDQGNWPDLREFSRSKLLKGEVPPFPVLWCHGAIGIGLVRMSQYEATSQLIYAAEAGAALQAAIKHLASLLSGGPIVDSSLCHGLAGIAELLLEGGRVFDEASLVSMGRECARVLAESGVAGEWPSGVPGGGENPSLMLGMAGTGLVLLRASQEGIAPAGLLYAVSMEPQRLIVQLNGDMAADQVRDSISGLNDLIDGSQIERVSRRGRVLLRVPKSTEVQTVLQTLNALPYVEYAEADVTDQAQDTN